MSEVDKIKPLLDSVQNDFVATLNANPSLTDQELIKKFPELNEFAKYGVPVNQSVSYLRQYYADTKSGKYQDLTSLKNDYSVDSFVAKKTPVQTEPKSQPKADPIDAVQNDFVATMNANPSLTDQQILEKFPEIKTGWQNPQEGIDYLRSYYADTKSGKYQDLASLKEAYSLKKKDTTQQTTTPLDGNQFQAPTSDTSQATSLLPSETGKPKSPLALGGSTLGLEGTGLESQGQLPETVLPSTGAEQQSYLGPYKAGLGISDPSQVVTSRPTETQRERDTLKKFPSVDQLIDDTIPIPQYGQVQNADTNSLLMNSDTGKPFGSSVAKKDLLESQRAEAETGVLSGITQDITKQSNKFYEDAFDQKLSTMLGLPADVVQQNKEEWAFKSKVAGQGEESGMTQDDIAVRDRYANNYVRKNADLIRDEYFDDLTSKLGSSAPEYWKKKGNEIAVSYLTENDLAIKDLKDKITTLEATENRTPQQEIELKKYKGTLDTLVDIKYTGKDLFTDNGAFIANKKIQIEDQGKFIDSVNKYAAIYDGTDKATLTKERDNAYFQYLYAQNMRNDIYEKQVELQSQNPGDNSLRQEWINAGKYAEDRLAYFMGINRALLLNEDPGTGAEDTFFTGIAEGFKEAMGIESQSASALRDHAITGIQAAGYEATEDQLDKAGQDFFEKAGRSVGSSLPIMAEIGVNLLLTNKIAGALAIPKLAQTLAGGNKMKQFGLNLIYDTASQSLAFAASGESGFAGAGEGVGQALGTAILGRFGVTNKLANIGVRLATGTATETLSEYAGEFIDEAQKNGWDFQKASENTFGKTAEEGIEKLALIITSAAILGGPGSVLGSGNGNENSFLFATEGMKEVQKSDSDSPIVKHAQENDFTIPPTEEEIKRKDEILAKKSSGETVTEEELNEATLTETKEEFQKTKDIPADNIAPVISKTEGSDTEYKFNELGEEGFISEKELLSKLDDQDFIQKVSSGEIGLNIINPSQEVESKIIEKFPEKPLKTEENVNQENIEGVSSQEQIRQEPVGTKPIETASTEEATTSGDVQAQEEVRTDGKRTVINGKKLPMAVEHNWSSGKDVKVETSDDAVNFADENSESIINDYLSNNEKGKNGIIDPDAVREYFAETGYDGKNVPTFVQASNKLTEAIFQRILKESPNKKITFLTGVGGSGKTRATKGKLDTTGRNVYDSAFNYFEDLDKKINEAKSAGFEIEVAPVYNDAKTAWNNTVKRGKEGGRFLSLEYFLNSFIQNTGKLSKIFEKHKDVTISPIDNSGNNSKKVSLDESLEWDYRITDEQVVELLKTIANDTKLSPEQLASIGSGIRGIRKITSEWTSEMEGLVSGIEKRIEQKTQQKSEGSREANVGDKKQTGESGRGERLKTKEDETKSETETKTSPEAGVLESKDKKIKEASKKLAEKIRSGKIKISLDKFSTSPKPIIDAVINSALEAVALTIEANGTIAQAVADGMRVIQNSEWFKSLTEEKKEEVQDQIAQQLTDQLEAESEIDSDSQTAKTEKTKIPDLKTEKKKEPGSNKTNPKNKAFSERLGKQTNLKDETKSEILKDAKNEVQNQKELLKQTTNIFNRVMKETDGNYEEVLKIADGGNITTGHRELLYAHVMQHLADLEKNTDPSISKAASNRLIELGRIIADRLNESGKQIAAMATVYKNFPMYEFYQKLAVIEKLNSKSLNNTNKRFFGKRVTVDSIKEEATKDVESIIKDIEDNFSELFSDERFAKIIDKLQKKIDGRKRPVKNLDDKKKKELQDKKKAALDRFFGRKGTLQATIPGVQQVGAIIEYAAVLIEEGFYRSKDIIAEIKYQFNSRGANLTDSEIKRSLEKLKQFREILSNEDVSTRKDSFEEIMKRAISDYLREGLSISNMTMDQALVSSDKKINEIKSGIIENLKNNFDLSQSEAESAISAIDQVFREKAVQKLKKKFDKFYPEISPKKAIQKKEVDKLAEDVSLGALDTTFEFMNMTFQKYGLIDLNNPNVVNDIKQKAEKISNAPDGVLKDKARKDLETYLHKIRGGYGWKDWFMTRFYASILSGPITHAKNLKYNSMAVGIISPISQMFTKGANPISTYKEMLRSFYQTDRKVAAHYVKTGDNFIDPSTGPKNYADALEFNLIKTGFTKLLNLASTRLLVASDMALTKPLASAIYRNNVKVYLRNEKGLKGKELEKAASEMMGYTEENVEKSTKQAVADIKEYYGFDPFTEDVQPSIQKEATVLLLLRTNEWILENSGIEEKMGADNWLDAWNGETLLESSEKEAQNTTLTGEVLGTVGIMTSLLDKVTDKHPALKFKIPFSRIIGNMLNLGIKWSPGIGQLQVASRYFINKSLVKKGMPTISSSLLYAINRITGDSLVKSDYVKSLDKEISYRQVRRDFTHTLLISATQALIYSLMAKDDEDDGFVITGALDPSFFLKGSITKGTGVVPWGVYWRDSDGNMTFISEYKNSITGYALAFFGELTERKMQDDNTAAALYMKSLRSSIFFTAEKPALTGLKEAFEFLQLTDEYGNIKLLQEKGYTDAWAIKGMSFLNSFFIPNLFKQTNKIGEQVYGLEEKRATNWWQAAVKGLPFINQDMLETQYDHFGRPIEQKIELGFLGIMGDAEKGFTMLEPNEVDPYYKTFTDKGLIPKWYSETEIPIYSKNPAGNFVKNEDGEKTRISKYEGHILNMLIGKYRKELMDSEVEYDMATDTYTYGLEAYEKMDKDEFSSKMRTLNTEAKEKAYKEFFEKYRTEESKISNEEKEKKYIKTN